MEEKRMELKIKIKEDLMKLIQMEFEYSKLAVALKDEGIPFGKALTTLQRLKHDLMSLDD